MFWVKTPRGGLVNFARATDVFVKPPHKAETRPKYRVIVLFSDDSEGGENTTTYSEHATEQEALDALDLLFVALVAHNVARTKEE